MSEYFISYFNFFSLTKKSRYALIIINNPVIINGINNGLL